LTNSSSSLPCSESSFPLAFKFVGTAAEIRPYWFLIERNGCGFLSDEMCSGKNRVGQFLNLRFFQEPELQASREVCLSLRKMLTPFPHLYRE
jgi:hypothetical protein